MRDDRKQSCIIVVLLIIASCAAFSPVAQNDFINFDDNLYLTENSQIQSGISLENIKWATTAIVASNWHPLTLISHMLDWSLFGANAAGHHLVSLLLHIGAVLFLFLFWNRSTKNIWSSAFVAAFFALHPLRVESVAWAAERKDVLCMFFGMASLYSYGLYVEKLTISRYLLCLFLFIAALLSKPMMITLPFVFMLLDYWPLKRWQAVATQPDQYPKLALIEEKTPFFFLMIFAGILVLWAQHESASIASLDNLSFFNRVDNAIVSYGAYLLNIFWPADLAVFYPYSIKLPLWEILISAGAMILITLIVFSEIKKMPFLLVGWFWYLGTLVPMIGLVQIGSQSIADRYTYLPSIGIAIMLAWGMPYLLAASETGRIKLKIASTALLIILTILTWQQCGYWRNSITVFSHALGVTERNDVAHLSLGNALYAEGKIEEAIYHYDEAIFLKPYDAKIYNNRGVALATLGHYQRAIDDFNEAIRLRNDIAEPYENRGTAFYNLSEWQRAVDNFNEAIRLRPDFAGAYLKRAFIHLNHGKRASGCKDAFKACVLGSCSILEDAKARGYCR